jgi:hypothetical protein
VILKFEESLRARDNYDSLLPEARCGGDRTRPPLMDELLEAERVALNGER